MANSNPKPPNAGMGRPKGAVNKTTASVKAALEEAFNGMGGVPSLMAWAEKEPAEFYKLWVKMLPTEVKADVSMTVLASALDAAVKRARG